MSDKHLFITCSYIPPNSDISIYRKHASLICEVAKRFKTDRAVVFFSELFDHNLGQYNRTPNCNGRLLDLCFVNFPEIYVNRCPPFSLPEDPYHPSICISFHHINDGLLKCLNVPNQTSLNNYYDFHKINIVLLKHRLSLLTLDFSTGSIESLLASFYNTLNLAIAASVPIKHCRPRSRCPPWFIRQLNITRIEKTRNSKNIRKVALRSTMSLTRWRGIDLTPSTIIITADTFSSLNPLCLLILNSSLNLLTLKEKFPHIPLMFLLMALIPRMILKSQIYLLSISDETLRLLISIYQQTTHIL
ncbi:uncharacterized protein ACN2A1_001739 [Glossina fuscipes fuscipes]